MTSARPRGDKAWDYVRLPEAFKPLIQFEERTAGIYELVALEGLPSKVASNRPDGSYATKDLFTPHPSIPDAWKYFARLDDTIVLVNGEKAVPIAFEQSIRDNVNVREAVMFGSGKDRVGMLIILSSATQDLSQNDIERSLFPDLARANDQMPAYAQVTLDMVKILPHDTEFPRTDKGTAIRAAFYRKFEAEIEEVYQNADVSTGTLSLSEVELKHYIRTELNKILPPSSTRILEDATDFFSIGVDSLQAIRLRSALNKEINTNGMKLNSNIVFDFPSIESLAQELYRLGTGGDLPAGSSVLTQMENLIAKYSTFAAHSPVETTKEGHCLVSPLGKDLLKKY
jgi:Phosphopantetheine attachment site